MLQALFPDFSHPQFIITCTLQLEVGNIRPEYETNSVT